MEVDIDFGPSALELTVSNPIRAGQAASGPAHGIVGMRERAALLGGSLETGAENGLYRMRALLPYGGDGT